MIVTKSESGKATNDITVVRAFIRKRKSTITTNILPSNRLRFTLLIELSMKRLWRKISVDTFTSAGKFFCRSIKTASRLAVNCSVLVSGCFVTVISTAGSVLTEAVPSFGLLPPIRTLAMSAKVTG